MPLFDHFSILAPIYDQAIPSGERDKFLALLAAPPRSYILDAGGGTGRVAQLVRCQACHVVVADLSWGMLRQGRRKEGLRLVNAPTERLPFPSGRFERVIMVDALHHVCDQPATAEELWRVLKPGGRIVIEEPDVRTLVVKIVAVVEKLALMRSHFLSPSRIAALFPPQALTRIETQGYTAWVVVEKPGERD